MLAEPTLKPDVRFFSTPRVFVSLIVLPCLKTAFWVYSPPKPTVPQPKLDSTPKAKFLAIKTLAPTTASKENDVPPFHLVSISCVKTGWSW